MLPVDFIRTALGLCLLGMLALALLYLRRRALAPLPRAAWILLALLLPAVGPFLVLLLQPGRSAALEGRLP
ncbi:MAG TPA: hypothetical protein PKW33_07890 [Anaerolineaceae bacterium]|nr:hypothetical protein [Anaerolineaceae bacterium]HPN51494.1 hypothetical protein [Anaerolineaceae bacterium]